MKFEIADGTVLVRDDCPGAYATLFVAKGKLSKVLDRCSFDDAARDYLWVFACDVPMKKGAVLVFATADREVAAEIGAGGEVLVSDHKVTVSRADTGEPIKVKVKTKWFG